MKRLIFAILLFCINQALFAQGWVTDEVAKESSDGIFGGVLGAILLFGIIWFLSSLFSGSNKSDSSSDYKDNHVNDHIEEKDDELDVHCLDEDVDDEPHIATPSALYKQPLVKTTPQEVSSPNTRTVQPKHGLNDKDFKERCLAVYGDYAENTYCLVLVKEDGEYRQISYPDKRYEILTSYLYEHHKERNGTASIIGDGGQLKLFIENIKEKKVFPEAKPMESHGVLEKEYLGERIAMMMSYYDKVAGTHSLYTSNAPSLQDYCLSLGLDLAVYIHRYIKQPMEASIYHHLKDMELRQMTKDDYLEYRSKADKISMRGDGVYDGWDNYIGSDFDEAKEVLDKREVITYAQAIKEVKEIKWEL